MLVSTKVEGLQDVLKSMDHIFPKDREMARRILNQGMGASARKTMLPIAKQMADRGKSGALSESLAVRSLRKRDAVARGVLSAVQITPVRFNYKAMALYINYYYLSRGKTPPDSVFTSGIRHGHLVEWGSKNNAAYPYLYPAAKNGRLAFEKIWARMLWQKTKANVRRIVKKSKMK